MYKMAVSDIDGTLIGSNDKLSENTIKTIKRLQEKGIIFTLCTGRNIRKTLPIANALGIKAPFVCIDGILLFDPVKKSPVYNMNLTYEQVKYLVELGIEYKTFIEVSDGFKYYKHLPDKDAEKYDFFNKHTFSGRIKSYAGGIRYFKNPEKLCCIKEPIYQVTLACEKRLADEISDIIRKSGIGGIEVRDFIWDGYLFINRNGMGKARGVKILCEYFGVSPDEVVAFGDENNDIDMLEFVGMGVAVENAVEKVKAVSDFITLSNDNDGVAYAVNRFF